MTQILLFILLGLGPGALIAGIALGVVLSYRGAGIINLATGGIAMLAGYAFWALRTDQLGVQMSTVPALIVGLLFTAFVGVVIELVVFRPLRRASPLAKLVSSLGVLLIAQATVVLAFGTTPQNEPNVLPQNIVSVFGAVIPIDRFILTGIIIVMAAALWALYRFTRFGLATRAASENQVAAMLGGLSPNLLSMVNTLIASLIAGALGILAASITELDSETLPLQIVPALAAALLARFTSFGIACAAGIGLGVIESLIQYVSALSWFPTAGGVPLPGVAELVIFLIIVATMFLRGGRLPSRGDLVEQRLPMAPRPRNLTRTTLIACVICAVALVVLPFDFREAEINSLIGTLMALSLVVLTGYVGQISVVQLSLAGVSGFTISHLAVNAGIGFPLAPLLGTAVAVLLGLITAVSALRVRGVSLAVVTLAAAVAISNFGFLNPTWGGGQTGSPIPDPHLFGLDLGPNAGFRGLDGNVPSPVFGWVVLAVTIALCALVAVVRRGTLGQRMLAVRSNERAAAGAAIDPRRVKLIAFGISALIAGLAGALYGYNFGSVSADRFDAFTALSLIAFAYAGGITLISGAVFAGLISTQALLPYALDKWFGLNGNWFLLFGGVILIFTLIQNPEGVAGDIYRRTHKRPIFSPELPERPPAAAVAVAATPTPAPAPAPARPSAIPHAPVLTVTGLSVAFGGVKALSDVDIEVREGELVGLIGPNGAGKTTALKAILGLTDFTGELNVLGYDPRKQRDKLMEQVCFIADVAVLPRWIRVQEAVDFVANVHPRFDRKKCEAFLARTKLQPGQRVRQMSKGMIVQLHLALVMAIDARLLVLDEPTLGLDILYRKQFYQSLLEDYFDENKTIIVTTHQVEEVEHILTDLMFIRDGKIVLDADMDAIGERFIEVMVNADKADAARSLKPLDERQVFGKSIFLFDGVGRAQLEALGETRRPSVSDLFVATMKGTYA
ncbi:MAG TPA: ATP-binding cassette domain-containing protein [Solirubrobacteraceae bacterium]|nr:ATP-binding cassette domain-containing protein [Solirubrobacteraceae bacterium]